MGSWTKYKNKKHKQTYTRGFRTTITNIFLIIIHNLMHNNIHQPKLRCAITSVLIETLLKTGPNRIPHNNQLLASNNKTEEGPQLNS